MKLCILLFDGFTALDVVGGYEVLARLPDFHIAGPIVRFEDAGDVYAVRELPVAFTPGPRRNPA